MPIQRRPRGALLAFVALALGVPASAPAQGAPAAVTLTGRVTEAVSGTPLAGATVGVEGTLFTSLTDDAGRYRIEGVPSGPQVVRAIRVGYAPVRRSVVLPSEGTYTLDLAMAKSALQLPNLVVTADPSSRARGELGTASVIEREAIRNQTAASLAGVLELVPGTVLQPPGLDGVQQFALRAVPISPASGSSSTAAGPSASLLASFGTQIVLDGVPISNNVNLQSLGPRGELTFATAAGGGIDLRRIPAATLERVEVIRGIPSTRFGDLTQGVVLVDTRAGAVDPELQVRLDARTIEGTLVGGHTAGRGGAVTGNVDLTRTRLAPGSRDNTGSRIASQFAHRAEGRRLTLDTRLDFFQVLEDQPESPVFPGQAAKSRDNGLRLSERARWQMGGRTRLELTAAFEGVRQRSFTQSPRLRGAMPFTNRLTEGRQDGKFIGGPYLARVDLKGDPRQFYSRLELTSPMRWAGAEQTLRLGGELRREWSGGPGIQFDVEFPPQVEFNGVQGFDRPRRFDDIPPLVTSSLYLDDRASATLGNGWRLGVQGGVRLDLLHRGSSWVSGVRDQVVQPRLQVELEPARWFRLRAGGGELTKVPALADLYPSRQYYDLVNFNFFANDSAERRAILTTRILERVNPNLRMSRADKLEVGLEADLGEGSQLAVNGFFDRVRDAVGVLAEPTFLIRERFAVDSSTVGMGRPPEVLEPPFAADTIPTLIDRAANNLRLRSSGVELTAILPELRPIHTRLALQGAWTKSRLTSSGVEFGTLFDEFQLNQRQLRSPYWENGARTGERVLLTSRVIHHQPRAGLVVTGIFQFFLREVRQTEAATDTLAFAGYITRSGQLIPVPRERRGDPEFADLRRPLLGVSDARQSGPVDFLFSLQVSKTLPLDGRLSFYAFNAFDRLGSSAGRSFEPNRFGLEITMPLGLSWGGR